MNDSDQQQILLPREVAAIFRIHPHSLGRWVREGKIKHFRTAGGHVRFRREDIEEALKGDRGE
jgi:excisionase family DNA binding protein